MDSEATGERETEGNGREEGRQILQTTYALTLYER